MNKILLFLSILITLFSTNSFALEDNIQGNVVQDNFRICEKDSDCIEVPIECGGCCIYDAINKNYKNTYYELFNESCKGYSGPICDCIAQNYKTTCSEGKCLHKVIPFDPLK